MYKELQHSVATIAETLTTTQRNLVTISRSLWAVRISVRELRPDFERRYLNHFAEPEQAFDKMRDNLLDYGRELADIARHLRGESSRRSFFQSLGNKERIRTGKVVKSAW